MVSRGIIFVGCSFTWGQGLYFYKDFESLKIPTDKSKNVWNHYDVTEGQLRFMESKRFPRLVANHFDTFEMVIKENGGSDKTSANYWYRTIGKSISHPFSDYSNIIFQLTMPVRSSTVFEYENKKYEFNPFTQDTNVFASTHEIFNKWLIKNNLSMDDWYKIHVKDVLNYIKNMMIYFESNNIKSNILIWPEVYYQDIVFDDFLKDRFIDFEYENIKFNSIESLSLIPGMSISNDEITLGKKIDDDHPSMSCHRLIADSIIKKLSRKII